MNDSVATVQAVKLAIEATYDALPTIYLDEASEEAFELFAAKVLTELLSQGYLVMTQAQIMRVFSDSIAEGFNTLGKGK